MTEDYLEWEEYMLIKAIPFTLRFEYFVFSSIISHKLGIRVGRVDPLILVIVVKATVAPLL